MNEHLSNFAEYFNSLSPREQILFLIKTVGSIAGPLLLSVACSPDAAPPSRAALDNMGSKAPNNHLELQPTPTLISENVRFATIEAGQSPWNAIEESLKAHGERPEQYQGMSIIIRPPTADSMAFHFRGPGGSGMRALQEVYAIMESRPGLLDPTIIESLQSLPFGTSITYGHSHDVDALAAEIQGDRYVVSLETIPASQIRTSHQTLQFTTVTYEGNQVTPRQRYPSLSRNIGVNASDWRFNLESQLPKNNPLAPDHPHPLTKAHINKLAETLFGQALSYPPQHA